MDRGIDRAVDVLIVGAGPTGIGASWRIQELRELGLNAVHDWLLVEQCSAPGGMAASFRDAQGFTWDIGVHVIYSHYPYFNEFLKEVLGEGILEHPRKGWVWLKGNYIPFPLQNNLQRLPADDLLACVASFPNAAAANPAPANFSQWISQHFGTGLADLFFLPYAYKMWAYPAEQLATTWTERKSSSKYQNVQRTSLLPLVENLIRQQDAPGWDGAIPFPYPAKGGAGALWSKAFSRLPKEHAQLGKGVVSIDTASRVATLSSGERVRYASLLSSMPLDAFVDRLDEGFRARLPAPVLKHSSSHVIGVGVHGAVPEHLRDKFWIQFAQLDLPFFRISITSNYSPDNVPSSGHFWSLMCEVSESPLKPVNDQTVVPDVIAALRLVGLLSPEHEIASIWHRPIAYGYPVPCLERDAYLDEVQALLKENGIYSRGRFGGWKYEVSNQDNAFMQGVEAIDNMVLGTEELTYMHPELVCRTIVDRQAGRSFLNRQKMVRPA